MLPSGTVWSHVRRTSVRASTSAALPDWSVKKQTCVVSASQIPSCRSSRRCTRRPCGSVRARRRARSSCRAFRISARASLPSRSVGTCARRRSTALPCTGRRTRTSKRNFGRITTRHHPARDARPRRDNVDRRAGHDKSDTTDGDVKLAEERRASWRALRTAMRLTACASARRRRAPARARSYRRTEPTGSSPQLSGTGPYSVTAAR